MELHCTLRATTCDVLELASAMLVVSSSSRRSGAAGGKRYFVPTSEEPVLTNQIQSVTPPSGAVAVAPLSTSSHSAALLVCVSSSPRQLGFVSDAQATTDVLDTPVQGDIQHIEVAENVVVVQTAGGVACLFRVDALTASPSSGCLKHLGDVSLGESYATHGSQWVVSVSAPQAGVQEAVIVAHHQASGETALAVVDISSTIASARGPAVRVSGLPAQLPITAYTVSWIHRRVDVILDGVLYTAPFPSADRKPLSWSQQRTAFDEKVEQIVDTCDVAGKRWVLVSSQSRLLLRQLAEAANGVGSLGVTKEVAIGSVDAANPRIAVVCRDVYVLAGRSVFRLQRADDNSQQVAVSSALTRDSTNSLELLLGTPSTAVLDTAAQTKAALWADHLARANSKQPPGVLRDRDYSAASGHLILNALASKCLNDSTKFETAATRYFLAASSVEPASVVYALRLLAERRPTASASVLAGVFLAVWAAVSRGMTNEIVVEHFMRGHVEAVRSQQMDAAIATRLFTAACEAAHAMLDSALVTMLPLACAFMDALAITHAAAISNAAREEWARIAGRLSYFAEWALDSVAPKIGMFTAHCGAPLSLRKEAQFVDVVARRIQTTKEVDISQTSIVVAKPGAAAAAARGPTVANSKHTIRN